jgi:hypothetical protein
MDFDAIIVVGLDGSFEPSLGCSLLWVVHFNLLTNVIWVLLFIVVVVVIVIVIIVVVVVLFTW